MQCHLRWTVASVVVLDSNSIADAIVCACTKLFRDLWEYGLIHTVYKGILVGASPNDK